MSLPATPATGWIAKYDLVALADPRQAIPPYDAILLLSSRRADDVPLRTSLETLLGRIDIATMREANLRAGGSRGHFRRHGRALAVGEGWRKVAAAAASRGADLCPKSPRTGHAALWALRHARQRTPSL